MPPNPLLSVFYLPKHAHTCTRMHRFLVCVGCMHVNEGTDRGQKKASNPLKLESQATVSHVMCWKAHCQSVTHCEMRTFLLLFYTGLVQGHRREAEFKVKVPG